jgi:3'-phosphoadenosine 5'-phosphosulfate sulfotransferase (PAPS reductase)/FAD synthetase
MGRGIIVPPEVRAGDLDCIVSMSGGKDSTATALALQDAGIAFSMVFADTDWEAPETYAHLDYLRGKLGPIDVVSGSGGGMEARIVKGAHFPSRLGRWCTRELKVRPLRDHHDRHTDKTGRETVSVMGIRAGESVARSQLKGWEDEPTGPRSWGGWIWRPLLSWSVDDVLEIHARHGVRLNPLYLHGHDRVGCFPCIFSRKEEIRLIAETHPERITTIRRLEETVTQERNRRNAETPGRCTDGQATFFQTQRQGFSGIDAVALWARTDYGGRQLPLLAPVPTGGCMRWGTCEPPAEDRPENPTPQGRPNGAENPED